MFRFAVAAALAAGLVPLAGVTPMPAQDDKKKDDKDPPRKERNELHLPLVPETKGGKTVWAEKVSVRRYLGQADIEFQNPHRDVDAVLCKTKKGEYVWWLSGATGGGGTVGGRPRVKSEITDGYGVTWVVVKTAAASESPWICYAEKKK